MARYVEQSTPKQPTELEVHCKLCVPLRLALSCRGKSNLVVSLTAMFICLIHHHPHPPNRPVYSPFSPPSSLATATQHTQRMTACCGVHDADSATMVLVERAQTLLMNA